MWLWISRSNSLIHSLSLWWLTSHGGQSSWVWSQLVSYALWGFIWLTRSSWVLSRPVDGMMTSCHFALPHLEEGIGNSGSWPSREPWRARCWFSYLWTWPSLWFSCILVPLDLGRMDSFYFSPSPWWYSFHKADSLMTLSPLQASLDCGHGGGRPLVVADWLSKPWAGRCLVLFVGYLDKCCPESFLSSAGNPVL